VMATVAGMTSSPCLNTTLGRNLLDPRFERGHNYTFIQKALGPQTRILVLDEKYVVQLRPDGSEGSLHDYTSDQPGSDLRERDPERFAEMRRLALGLRRTAEWLLYHNRPERYVDR